MFQLCDEDESQTLGGGNPRKLSAADFAGTNHGQPAMSDLTDYQMKRNPRDE